MSRPDFLSQAIYFGKETARRFFPNISGRGRNRFLPHHLATATLVVIAGVGMALSTDAQAETPPNRVWVDRFPTVQPGRHAAAGGWFDENAPKYTESCAEGTVPGTAIRLGPKYTTIVVQGEAPIFDDERKAAEQVLENPSDPTDLRLKPRLIERYKRLLEETARLSRKTEGYNVNVQIPGHATPMDLPFKDYINIESIAAELKGKRNAPLYSASGNKRYTLTSHALIFWNLANNPHNLATGYGESMGTEGGMGVFDGNVLFNEEAEDFFYDAAGHEVYGHGTGLGHTNQYGDMMNARFLFIPIPKAFRDQALARRCPNLKPDAVPATPAPTPTAEPSPTPVATATPGKPVGEPPPGQRRILGLPHITRGNIGPISSN